jgi:hypothetical protein
VPAKKEVLLAPAIAMGFSTPTLLLGVLLLLSLCDDETVDVSRCLHASGKSSDTATIVMIPATKARTSSNEIKDCSMDKPSPSLCNSAIVDDEEI